MPRIFNTLEFDGLHEKGHIELNTLRFETLHGKRTKLTILSVYQTTEDRDSMINIRIKNGVSV